MNFCLSSFRNLWDQMSRDARIILLGILVLGVFLRAFHLDIFEFKGDELEGIVRGLAAPAQHWWIDHGATASVQNHLARLSAILWAS